MKSQLHESIENIDDEDLLLTIKQLVDRKYTPAIEPKLADWQIARLAQSANQIHLGQGITNEQADELVNKWLNG